MQDILINHAGLYKCCLASVSEYSKNFPVSVSDIYQCPLCGESMEVVEEGENLCWQKLELNYDANTCSN